MIIDLSIYLVYGDCSIFTDIVVFWSSSIYWINAYSSTLSSIDHLFKLENLPYIYIYIYIYIYMCVCVCVCVCVCELIEHFTYLGSNIASVESDISISAIEMLSTLGISNISDKIKLELIRAVAASERLYGFHLYIYIESLGEKARGKLLKDVVFCF